MHRQWRKARQNSLAWFRLSGLRLMILLFRSINGSLRHASVQVDTTGVPTMSNPIRFGQDFVGKIANPRDVLVFHRAKKSAARRVVADEPELAGLDGDEEGDGIDKLAAGRVRVHSLVQEYLSAQEMQLLGEAGMSDAIQIFVEKDDIHAISKYVSTI